MTFSAPFLLFLASYSVCQALATSVACGCRQLLPPPLLFILNFFDAGKFVRKASGITWPTILQY